MCPKTASTKNPSPHLNGCGFISGDVISIPIPIPPIR